LQTCDIWGGPTETLHRNSSDVPNVTIWLPKRVHFSLRGLLTAMALFAIGTYWFVVRPTTMPERFVADVTRGDFAAANLLLKGDSPFDFGSAPDQSISMDRAFAELLPWEWQDAWKCRRRLTIS
jgi:hypothetical protein